MMQLYMPVPLSNVRYDKNTSHDDFVLGLEVVVVVITLFLAIRIQSGNVTFIVTQMHSNTCVFINDQYNLPIICRGQPETHGRLSSVVRKVPYVCISIVFVLFYPVHGANLTLIQPTWSAYIHITWFSKFPFTYTDLCYDSLRITNS